MKSLISETHSITPRRPAFDFSKSSLHWIKDDPIASNILNVIHPITPAPERWFCQTFREALPYIQDEKLKQAAIAFIKQEASHSYGHTLVNRQLHIVEQHLQDYLKLLDWIFDDMIGSNPLGIKLKNAKLKKHWLKTRLGMVAAAEHITGVLGHWVLNAETLEKSAIEIELFRLLQWHGAEEVEHREVADAMFRSMSNSITLRTASAVFIFPLFSILAILGIYQIMEKDTEFPQPFKIRDYLRAARQDRVPKAQMLLKAGIRYFNPKHSPLNEGNTQQALNFLKKMGS